MFRYIAKFTLSRITVHFSPLSRLEISLTQPYCSNTATPSHPQYSLFTYCTANTVSTITHSTHSNLPNLPNLPNLQMSIQISKPNPSFNHSVIRHSSFIIHYFPRELRAAASRRRAGGRADGGRSSLTHSLTHSVPRSATHVLNWPTHSLTYSLTQWPAGAAHLTHSLTHSLTHITGTSVTTAPAAMPAVGIMWVFHHPLRSTLCESVGCTRPITVEIRKESLFAGFCNDVWVS